MLFKSKKKEKKLELLYRENVVVNENASSKEEVIRQAGQLLVDKGYVNQSYVDAMIKREETCSTFMGNGLALPHGVEEAKKEVLSSGISVVSVPNGIDWGGEEVKIVIGIAGVGDDHLEILGKIADKMLSPEQAEELLSGNADTIYKLLAE